jgi:activator of HSP90 ATPase
MTPNHPTLTRRQAITTTAMTLGSLALAGRAAAQDKPAKSGEVITVNAIHQEVDFAASPQRIYEALLDARQFTDFSGGRVAVINPVVGAAFSVFAGHIIGRNLELVPNRRIVQAWRVVPWPEGVYSIARIELNPQGAGTRVVLDHTGFPTELAEHLASGWHENYWDELRKYLAAGKH